jgi:hypothetical protein
MSPEERFERIETLIEKQNAGIRDLIVVTGTALAATENLVVSQKEVTVQIKELREAQSATDEKLNILIDTVDRIIRHKNGQT